MKPLSNERSAEEDFLDFYDANDEALFAYYILTETNTPVFLTGRAGTGKSTFINRIAQFFSPVLVVAPTGIAACHVRGQTINSCFHFPPFFKLPEASFIESIRFNHWDATYLTYCELVIIDEVSMVTGATLDCIDLILRRLTGKELPFGGKKVLMVGDLFQLSPVVKKEDQATLLKNYPSPYFFDANCFKEMDPVSIELKTNYRQKDKVFLDLLDSLRMAPRRSTLDTLNTACYNKGKDKAEAAANEALKSITLAFTTKGADKINKERLGKLRGAKHTYPAKVDGQFDWNSVVAEEVLHLKVGARVMLTKNDEGDAYVNGTLGYIKQIEAEDILVVSDEGKELVIEKATWETIKYKPRFINGKWDKSCMVVGSMQQFPLRLAWAITVHKSQGLTFDRVHLLNDTPSFAPGQLYVALSRCRTLEGLSLHRPLTSADVLTSERVKEFYRTLDDERRIYALLDEIGERWKVEATKRETEVH